MGRQHTRGGSPWARKLSRSASSPASDFTEKVRQAGSDGPIVKAKKRHLKEAQRKRDAAAFEAMVSASKEARR